MTHLMGGVMRAWPSLKRPAPAFEPLQLSLFFIFVGTINKKTGGSKHMQLTYDPAKSLRNEAERGLPFAMASDFDWSEALVVEDTRNNYKERRFQALGFIGEHLHMLVFTPRGDSVHVISLRRANQRERNR